MERWVVLNFDFSLENEETSVIAGGVVPTQGLPRVFNRESAVESSNPQGKAMLSRHSEFIPCLSYAVEVIDGASTQTAILSR